MKPCIRCKRILPIEEFYKHPMMRDGHLNKCKKCCRECAAIRAEANWEYIARYDRERFKRPERKRKVLQYQRKMRQKNPEKYLARRLLKQAVRAGRIERKPCEVCGEAKAEGHHDDYSKPLDVRWLCFKHHRQVGHGQRTAS